MSVEQILIAALLLAVPISMKYVLAFEVRKMVAILKANERHVARLTTRRAALGRERDVVASALAQVEGQGRRSRTRHSLIEEELSRIHSRPRRSQLERPEVADLEHTAMADALSATAEAYA